jgi:hypothetical protein
VAQPPLGPLSEALVAEMRGAFPAGTPKGGRRLMTLNEDEVLAEGSWEWGDPLFQKVLQASDALTMRRVRQPGIGQDPVHSGISLIRLQVRKSMVMLVTAPMRPAASPGGAPARAMAWSAGPRFGVRTAEGSTRWCPARADLEAAQPIDYGSVEIRLPGVSDVGSLPAATFAWDLAMVEGPLSCRLDGARVQVARPVGQPTEILAQLDIAFGDCAMPAGLCARWRAGTAAEPVIGITVATSLSDADPFGPSL